MKRHFCASAFVVDPYTKKILLIKHKKNGRWTQPGGHIEDDETPEEALVRELDEEAGVTVTDFELIGAVSRTFKWQMYEDTIEDLHHIGILYKVDVLEDVVKEEADGIDSNGCNFYKISELDKEQLTPFTIEGLIKLGYKL